MYSRLPNLEITPRISTELINIIKKCGLILIQKYTLDGTPCGYTMWVDKNPSSGLNYRPCSYEATACHHAPAVRLPLFENSLILLKNKKEHSLSTHGMEGYCRSNPWQQQYEAGRWQGYLGALSSLEQMRENGILSSVAAWLGCIQVEVFPLTLVLHKTVPENLRAGWSHFSPWAAFQLYTQRPEKAFFVWVTSCYLVIYTITIMHYSVFSIHYSDSLIDKCTGPEIMQD